MADYTDAAFRQMCKSRGCNVTVTEMVSATALVRGNRKSWEMAHVPKSEGFAGVQVFGNNAPEVAKACTLICEKKAKSESFPSFIDLNFGCPVKKITEQGAGAALLRDREKIAEIAAAAVAASPLPITAKIRLGWKKDESLEIALLLERAGISALTVHGRTANQGYSGKADWKAIAKAAEAVSIPVIGNGDVAGKKDAEAKMKETGCSGAMIGRAALGNPAVFSGKEKEGWQKLLMEYERLGRKHGSLTLKSLKFHASQFASGESEASRIRGKINSAKSVSQLVELAAPVKRE
jgi:nifR3 family TIM-barrel protein